MRTGFLGLLILLAFVAVPVKALDSQKVPRPAPEWDVSEWLNGDAVTLADLKGKVVLVEFFQLWCPGCNRFSIPLIKHWEKVFAEDITAGRLKVVSIHTVFEGHGFQTPTRLKDFLKEKEIKHLVGVDRQIVGEWLPETMRIYGTRGTPEMAFIDKKGVVRFQQFGGFDVDKAQNLLAKLVAEES